MSLDQNLFTLNVVPSQDELDAIDLVEPNGTIHYRKRRATGNDTGYAWSLFEPLSDGLLSTVTAPSATSKFKTLALHNPDAIVELKYTGTLSFKWCFEWEEHTFEWRREACYMLRKPDPPVQVAVTKEPSGRIKTSVVQILDYNLHRFDIRDRKGLEILMLTSLLTFTDQSDEYHARNVGTNQTSSSSPVQQRQPVVMEAPLPEYTPPPPPVPQKSPLDRIVMAQAQNDMGPNEILVGSDADVDDYARYGRDLLQDDNMLYIVLKSGGPEQVPKVLTVAEAIKRLRHKAGIEETLHLYSSYDETPRKGPKIIRLDDPTPSNANYKPPMNLTIHLSKIPMPELQPKLKKPSGPTSPSSRHEPPLRRRHSNEDPWLRASSSRQNGYASDTPPSKQEKDDRRKERDDKHKEKDDKRKEKDERKGKHEKTASSGKLKHKPPTPSQPFGQPQPGRPNPNAPGPSSYPARPTLNVNLTQPSHPPYMGRGNGRLSASPNSSSGRPLSGIFDRITSGLR